MKAVLGPVAGFPQGAHCSFCLLEERFWPGPRGQRLPSLLALVFHSRTPHVAGG